MFITIHIYSKNYKSMEQFLNFFTSVYSNEKLKVRASKTLFQRKTKRKFFSILKSPHVNKKAQEQFEYFYYKRQLTVFSYQILWLLSILKVIKSKLFSDVKLKVNFFSGKVTPRESFKSTFNPNSYILNDNKDKKGLKSLPKFNFHESQREKRFKNYLMLFDIYGETLLKK